MLAPKNNRGMTYQTDGNNISKSIWIFCGAKLPIGSDIVVNTSLKRVLKQTWIFKMVT